MKKLRFFLENMKLRNKIVLFTITLLLSSIFITGSLIYNQSAVLIKKNVTVRNSEINEQSAAFLDEKMRSILDQVQFIQTTETFKKSIEYIFKQNNPDYNLIYVQLHALLSHISLNEIFIHSIQIDTPIGIFYDTVLRNLPEERYLKDKEYFNMLYERNYRSHLSYWGNVEDLDPKDNTLPLLLTMPKWDGMFGFDEVTILVKLNQVEIVTYLEKVANKMNSEIYILDEKKTMVMSTKKRDFIRVLSDNVVTSMSEENIYNVTLENDGKNYIVSRGEVSLNGWQVIAITKEEDILKELQQIRIISYSIIALITVISIIFSILISKSITKPLKKLRRIMMTVQESNFDVYINDDSRSEIGDLSRAFNKMSMEIRLLLEEISLQHEKNLYEQKLKRKAELKALNEQINPHFLYNALDSIYWRSANSGNEEVAKMTLELSNIFRIGLNKGKEMTSLNKEIEHVNSYLALQKIIYSNKFDYQVTGPKECNDLKVIKLVLQPLVENSIVHGFENMINGGMIDVTITVDNNKVKYCVKDNGCGFHANFMQQILEEEQGDYEGYALNNIYKRLKLHYGQELEFKLYSEPGVMTSVVIQLPYKK